MHARAASTLFAFLSLSAIGCERRETVTTEQRAEYRRDATSRLERLEAEMDSLIARGHEAGAEARDEWNEAVASVRVQRDSARARIDRIEDAGQEAWEDVKEGTDRLLGRLEGSIGAARERLQSRADTTAVP
jgi:hypothetical protein